MIFTQLTSRIVAKQACALMGLNNTCHSLFVLTWGFVLINISAKFLSYKHLIARESHGVKIAKIRPTTQKGFMMMIMMMMTTILLLLLIMIMSDDWTFILGLCVVGYLPYQLWALLLEMKTQFVKNNKASGGRKGKMWIILSLASVTFWLLLFFTLFVKRHTWKKAWKLL